MRLNNFILFTFTGLVCGSFFRDIFRGITQSGRFAHLVTDVPQNIISDLENDEAEAGQFICQILHGETPTAITNLPEETWDEIEDDYSSLSDFVVSLPTIVPAVLNDIEQGGQVVVSIVTELIQNPGGELTVLIDDVETVFDNVLGDIETVAGEVASGIECLFKDCAAASATNTAQMNLVSNCQNILAAATSTLPAITTSTPSAAVTSTPQAIATSTIPAITNTSPAAASTSPAVTSRSSPATSIPSSVASLSSSVLSSSTAITSSGTEGGDSANEASLIEWRRAATWAFLMNLVIFLAF